MRIGARVGPVYASTSARGCAPFFTFIIVGSLIVGFPIAYPAIGIPIYVGLAALVILLATRRRRRKRPAPTTHPGFRVETRLAEIETLKRLHHEGQISDERFVEEVEALQRAVNDEFGPLP